MLWTLMVARGGGDEKNELSLFTETDLPFRLRSEKEHFSFEKMNFTFPRMKVPCIVSEL